MPFGLAVTGLDLYYTENLQNNKVVFAEDLII